MTLAKVKKARMPRLRYMQVDGAYWAPADMPRHLNAALLMRARNRIYFRSVRAERVINRRGKAVRPSRWVPRNRYLTKGPFAGSPWNPQVTPYVAPCMDAATMYPFVREIVVCKSPQTGYSTFVDSLMAWTAEFKPGPWLVVYPDRDTARKNANERIAPMFQNSPGLKRLLTDNPDDITSQKIALRTQTIQMGWSGSVTSLGNESAMYVALDETDKYDRGRIEASPVALAEKRATAFADDRRIFKISTPTVVEEVIWQAFLAAEAKFVWQVKCPDCGKPQVMQFEQIKAGIDDPAAIMPEQMLSQKLGRYCCVHCGSMWDDAMRNEAVLSGWYISAQIMDDAYSTVAEAQDALELEAYLKMHRPASLGFFVPAWISRFVSLSEVAAAYLKYKRSGDLDDLKDFYNGYCALPWKQIIHRPAAARIYQAVTDLPPHTVPQSGVVALTMGVDSQAHGYWYVIRAWGADMTSWLVQYGFVATDQELCGLIFDASWPVHNMDNLRYRISRIAIDTGGGKAGVTNNVSITERTYNLVRMLRQQGVTVYGIKGASRALEGRMKLGAPLDRTPSGKPIPGGIRILQLDTDKLKDLLFYRLGLAADHAAHQAAWLNRSIRPDEAGRDCEYVRQILAEEKQRNTKGLEEWVQVRKDNHLLDCEVYCHATADPEWPGGGVALLAANMVRQDRRAKVVKSKFFDRS